MRTVLLVVLGLLFLSGSAQAATVTFNLEDLDEMPVTPATFMMIVGVIEIVAGLAVLTVLTRLGAYVVMAWLVLISVAVILSGHYDIAVRDLVMAIGAYVLGQVAGLRGEGWLPGTTVNEGVPTHATTT